MPKAVVTLTDLTTLMLEVACRRCERKGRLRVSRLIAEYGDIGLPELGSKLSEGCPKRESLPEHGRCSIYFTDLAGR